MEEIKVGEYVRTKYSGIFKIRDIDFESFEIIQGDNRCWTFDDLEEMEEFIRESITKHSPDLIDLIEVGDYVNRHEIIYDLEKSKKTYNSKDDFVTAVRIHFCRRRYQIHCYT